jgi:hypothetical protein
VAALGLEAVHQALRIEARHVAHDLRIQRVRHRRRMIVAEIAGGHQQHVLALERAAEHARQGVDLRPRLAAHEEGHDAQPRHEMLEERELHLQGMLLAMGRGFVEQHVVRGEQRFRDLLVDGDLPERSGEGAARVDAHALEVHAVRRPDEHDGQVAAAAQPREGMGGHRTGVAEPGVGADQRDQAPGNLDGSDVREITLDLRNQGSAIPRIPRARDRGPPNAHHL